MQAIKYSNPNEKMKKISDLHQSLLESKMINDFGIKIEATPHKLESTVMTKPTFKTSNLIADSYGFKNTQLSEIPNIKNWIMVYTDSDYNYGN